MYALGSKSTNLLKVSLVALAAMLVACLLAIVVRVEPSQAAFPGQNGKIAFTRSSEEEPSPEIYTMNPDGSAMTLLTASCWSPAWSPDGTKIACTGSRSGIFGDRVIYLMNADGSGLTPLLDDPVPFYWHFSPAWSPDGKRIAFVGVISDEGDYGRIYVVNADGSDLTRLTHSLREGDADNQPNWSPDGSKIAFSSSRDNTNSTEIYAMNADGSNVIRLTRNSRSDYAPEWSPDGTKIAFWRYHPGSYPGNPDIYVMNADGSHQTNISDGPGDFDIDPDWSPDGTKIAFSRWEGDDGYYNVWVMDADGSNQIRLTDDPGYEAEADWQPLLNPTAPQTKAECKKGGYKEFGFKNQGQCIASLHR